MCAVGQDIHHTAVSYLLHLTLVIPNIFLQQLLISRQYSTPVLHKLHCHPLGQFATHKLFI